MVGYLFIDGFTSVFQEKMFKGYKMSTYNQMLYVNLCSGLITFFALISTDELASSINFGLKYPELFQQAFLLSLCAMMGQVTIYYSIKNYGALFFSTVMTTRQVFSILLSCLIYLHPLSALQWVGTGIVFGTLYYEAAAKVHHKKNESHQPTPSQPTNQDDIKV